MHPFAKGKEYIRGELLEYIGSRQRQSGVLWGSREPGCLICTCGSRHGKKVGYGDEELVDGTWWYFGQGTQGDQSIQNAANAKLASQQQSILLFTARERTAKEVAESGGYGKLFAFKGDFNVSGHEFFIPPSGARSGDRLMRFRLVPVTQEVVRHTIAEKANAYQTSISSLQAKLIRASAEARSTVLTLQEYRYRSALVREYALRRAGGSCEGCHREAPFKDENGDAFLEVHHLLRLADDGPDSPENVAALCPNCHRRAHFAADRHQFFEALREYVLALEDDISSVNADT